MAAVGDINFRDFEPGGDHFASLMEYFDLVDCSIGNLEGLFAEPEELFYKPGFKHVGEGHAPTLQRAGFKAVNLANNVTFGEEAIRTTLSQLDDVGIAHTGAGLDRAQAKRPARFEVNGLTVGIVGRTSVFWPLGAQAAEGRAGIMPLTIQTSYKPHRRHYELPGAQPEVITVPDPAELQELRSDIEDLRDSVDLLIAFFHFGVSSERAIIQYQRTAAQAAIDAGADAVLGSQTHVIQPIEVYQGCPIVYGMGQVIFGWDFIARKLHPGQPGLIVELDIDDESIPHWSARFVAPDVDLVPHLVSRQDVPEEVEYLQRTSSDVVAFTEDGFEILTGARQLARSPEGVASA